MKNNIIKLNKILITGTNGFFGKYLLKAFESNSILYTLNRTNSSYSLDLAKTIPIFNQQFDLVIHAAGKAHCVPKSDTEKQEFYNINVLGTKNLLEGLTNSGIPKYFVFISSVSVYGINFGYKINENTPLGALDPYGSSKIEIERMVIEYCKKHRVICTILRLPLIVGPNPPGNLGAMIKGIQNGYYFNIAGGKSKKSMVLAEDVAKSILTISQIGGTYNLTDGYHPSFAELSNKISYQLGKRKPINMPLWLIRIIARLGDLLGNNAPINSNKLNKITSDLTFDDTKARKTFGWNPTRVLDGFKINDN